jgi:hypothetical protein
VASAATTRQREAYQAAIVATRTRVGAIVERAWRTLPDYRGPSIDRFASTVAPIVVGAQRQVASLTDAHLAQLEAVALGRPAKPLGIPAAVLSFEALRAGSNALDVYRRPGVTVWTALAAGDDLEAAVDKGLTRAQVLAVTDVQLAKTHAARYVLEERESVVGYRRVPEPNACDLCATAADGRTYRTSALLPIHARCNCDVEPVFGVRPPRESSPDDDTFAVHQHDELGPVLTAAGDSFAGVGDL